GATDFHGFTRIRIHVFLWLISAIALVPHAWTRTLRRRGARREIPPRTSVGTGRDGRSLSGHSCWHRALRRAETHLASIHAQQRVCRALQERSARRRPAASPECG